jgi:hypothetical protein
VKRDVKWVSLWVCAALLAAVGCGTEADAGAEYTTVDSAGVTIVTSSSGAWTNETAWRVAPAPALDIGVLDGPEQYQLFQVRDARRLDDGRIVVANAGTNEIRFFDAQGDHLRSVGRQGSGPGEFEGLGMVRPLPGDSLLAYDFRLTRASVFDAEGAFGRSFRVVPPTEGGFAFAVDAFSDGTLVVRSPQLFQGELADGPQRRDEDHFTVSTGGEFLDSVGTFPGGEQYLETARSGENFMVSITQPPFGKSSVLAAHGMRFCHGTGDAYEVRCFGADGVLERIVRRDLPRRPVTPADLDAFKQQRLERADDDDARRRLESSLAKMPVPETMPPYDEIELDAGGNLWVREYAWRSDAPRRWTVFDADGRMLGDVATPAGLRVTQIGDDFVLGVWEDEYEVQHVRLYPLEKGE